MIDEVAGRDALPATLPKADPGKSAETQVPPLHVAAQPTGASQGSSPVDRKAVEQAITKIREAIGPANSSLKIEIDPELDRVVVKILDDQSGEIIRQIPSAEMVEIEKRLDMMQGIFITKRT